MPPQVRSLLYCVQGVASFLHGTFQQQRHQQVAGVGQEEKDEEEGLSVDLDHLVAGHTRLAAARWLTDVVSLQVRLLLRR
jgi:hypothetical protein